MSNIKQVFSKRISENKSIESFVDQHTITQGEIFTAIKDKNYPLALSKALHIMPLGARLKYVCEIFYRSKYRAYSLGTKRFKKEIDNYINTRDKDSIQLFYDILHKEEVLSHTDNGFYAVRTNILLSIIDDKHSLVTTVEHLLNIDPYSDIDDVERNKTERAYKKVLLEICSILYPQNQAFKVLFV